MAEVARKYDQAEFALRKARKYFESRSAKDNYAFIHRMERGVARRESCRAAL